uniref:ZSWIM3 N-terminal domain-containing protein n=1 Tax=Octopus bimaculoides TaxID=37653 RepID=A0A0L8GCE3_OCTBM
MRTHKEKVNSKLTFEMLTDVSKIFGDVFVQTAFDSFESFSELLHQFMNRTGYIYRIKSSCNANDHNKYRDKTRSQALRYVSVTFVCTQYGKPKDNSNTNRLKMHCKPVGCKSFLSLSSAKGLLRITKSNLEHNHKPLVGFSRSKIRRCKLSKEEIEEIAALNQHNSKYRVTRKRKQPISVTVPTSSDSHLLPPVTDDQTKPIEDHLIKKHKNNDFNDGQSDGRNNVEMVEKPQQFPSIPASNPKMEKVENIAQTVQFSVSSVQNLISQPEPVEKSQLPCEKFVLGVHKMSNQVSVWKNGKSCNSGTGNSSHAVMICVHEDIRYKSCYEKRAGGSCDLVEVLAEQIQAF